LFYFSSDLTGLHQADQHHVYLRQCSPQTQCWNNVKPKHRVWCSVIDGV
jgi:hypothetical protein